MSTPESIEIRQGRTVSDDENQLISLFQKLEADQIDLIDGAAKRITELTAGLLGTLFAVIALGKDFPPPYLKGDHAFQILTVATLSLYMIGMFLAMRTMQPRMYSYYRGDLTNMRDKLSTIVAFKSRRLFFAGAIFWLASALLALIVSLLVLAS